MTGLPSSPKRSSERADCTNGSTWEVSLESLRDIGEEIGFDAIGATSADDFPELRSRLADYHRRGATGYEWSDIDDRVQPKRILSTAKSIISVAIAYLTDEGKSLARTHPARKAYGQVTVYSYGEDYHLVLKRMLQDLHQRIEDIVGHRVEALPAVDTSPLVDRRVAERAGIGWIGKNCHLFTPDHGSFVFLGALMVDIEVERGEELPSRCGSCHRCLEACPTGALIAPGVIDATRCLSYVTQMKGIIPEEFRKPLGRRVWGCDTCQWACPENQTVLPSKHPEFLPEGELAYPDLIRILHLTNRAFQREYGQSAAAWRGLRTWQRNALIALGNSHNIDVSQAVSEIIPFLSHPRPELRASAAWALKQLMHPGGRKAVKQALDVEVDPEVRSELMWVQNTNLKEGECGDGCPNSNS